MKYPLVSITWTDATSCSMLTCTREEALAHTLIEVEEVGHYIGRKDGRVVLAHEIICDTLRDLSIIPESSVEEIRLLVQKNDVGLGELDSRLRKDLEKSGQETQKKS